MDSLLIDRWLDGAAATPCHDEASIAVMREQARGIVSAHGSNDVFAGAVATIVGELAHNQLAHARDGVVAIREIVRGEVFGVEIVAADRGEGIDDPQAAIDGVSTRPGGLGIGLSGAMRLADEFDFDVRIHAGTCIRARKFARRVARRREIAILSRPCEGERVDGDDAIALRTERGLRLALADGLGHGPEALLAASRAIEVVRAADDGPLEAILARADAELTATRGAVMSLVDLDEESNELVHAGVGNVTTHVEGVATSRRYAGSAFVLGAPRATRRMNVVEERTRIAPGDVVVVVSDGLRTSARVEPQMLRRHPILVAHRLLQEFARANDDATVIVAG